MSSPPMDQRLWSTLDESVRMRVMAARSARSPESLDRLAGDLEAVVRREVASNNSTADETLRVLLKDRDEEVVYRASSRLTPPPRWEDKESLMRLPWRQLSEMVASPSCPTWLTELAVKHRDARVRARVKASFAVPTLAKDPSRLVRASVAAGRSPSPQILESLAADPAPGVRRAVALNPGTPRHLLVGFLKDPDIGVRAVAARTPYIPWGLHQDPEPRIRREVAGNKNAAPEALEALASDEEPTVRLAVALNPYAPWSSIDQLAGDPHPKVSAAARRAVKDRESRLPTLRGEELWRALVARCGRPVRVMRWPDGGWGRLFTAQSTSDGFGSSDTVLRTSLPSDLRPSPDHLCQTRVFYLHQHIHDILDWRERVSEAGWDRPTDIPHLL